VRDPAAAVYRAPRLHLLLSLGSRQRAALPDSQAMNLPEAIVILVLLLVGPLAIHAIERNLELYILTIGAVATLLGRGFSRELVIDALREPVLITVAVVVAGLAFGYSRARLDRIFGRLRRRISRPVLTALAVFIVASVSSIITAIVAALVLVEMIGLLHLAGSARVNVTVAACFAIGLGAAMTPIGEPLSTLAAAALKLGFFGLFDLLAPWVMPGIAATAILAGYFARGDYHDAPAGAHARESALAAFIQGLRVYGFIAGLILVSAAYAPMAERFVPMLSDAALYWLNTLSAVLDNATLVALEVHQMSLERARDVIIALLLSGGMMIPGNIPNIVSAGALRIGSGAWARVGIPLGIALLGIYFAVLMAVG
jgi:predicted cation transporter